MVIRVLTWNLFHGRDFPPDPALRTCRSRLLRTTERNATHAQVNRPLLAEFAAWLAARDWDVALLQETPPRWLTALAAASRADGASALTSRNLLSPVRGLLASWSPDLIASNEGGSNQLLVRSPRRIEDVRRLTLTRWPERRRMLWARVALAGGGDLAVANLHASAGRPSAAAREVEHAAERAVEWAREAPLVFGGDLNVRPRDDRAVFERLHARFGLAPATGPTAIDHLLARGLETVSPPAALRPDERDVPGPYGLRLRLSDHAPVLAAFGVR